MALTEACLTRDFAHSDLDISEMDTRLTLERVSICPAHYSSQYRPDQREIAAVVDAVGEWAAMSQRLGAMGIGGRESAFLRKLWTKRAGMYDYFPHLFADAFPPIEPQVMRDLALSARLCYTATVLSDRITDQVYAPRPRLLSETQWMITVATRLLCQRFAMDSPFWTYFDACFDQQFSALSLESENHFHVLSPYPLEEMASIARGKAAMGKYVIAGIAVLTGAMDRIEPLFSSYDLYYIGYQLFDDVCDWREDYKRRIYSCLLTHAIERYREKKQDDRALPSCIELGQIIFDDLGLQHLQHAEAYYQRALDALGMLDCPMWRGMIQETRARTQSLGLDLVEIVDQQGCRYQKQVLKTLSLVKGHHRGDAFSSNGAGTKVSRAAAASFLLTNQHAEGYWRDFLGAPGASTEWVTGYVGLALAGQGEQCRRSLKLARDWLLSQRRSVGGWGYNEKVGMDVDSTVHCMLFLHTLGKGYPQAAVDLVQVLDHQDPATGGFCTYLPNALGDPNSGGWCSPAPSVTAAAMLLLNGAGEQRYTAEIDRALGFLMDRQTDEGYWHAYWWHGEIYSTAMALRALVSLDAAQEAVSRGLAWLLRTQKGDGSWGEVSSDGRGQPFATAMAIQALMAVETRNDGRVVVDAARRAIEWLVDGQLEDGSWLSYPIMRIPDADVLTPWDTQSFAVEKVKFVEDGRRVFTTATALAALTCYSALTWKEDKQN